MGVPSYSIKGSVFFIIEWEIKCLEIEKKLKML